MDLFKTLGNVELKPLGLFGDDPEGSPTISIVSSQQPLQTSNYRADLLQNLFHGQRYKQSLSFKTYGNDQTDY